MNGLVGTHYVSCHLPYLPQSIGPAIQRYRFDSEFALCVTVEKKKRKLKKKHLLLLLLIRSIHSTGLKVNIMVWSRSFRHVWLRILCCRDSLPSPEPLFHIPLSSSKGYPPLARGTPCRLPARDVWIFFWSSLYFSSTQSFLISPGRGRGICYFGHQQLTAFVVYTHTQKTNQNCTQDITRSRENLRL